MKVLLTATILFTGFFSINAQLYKPVDEKSEIEFTIKNFGINTNGSLNGLKGTINFNPSDLAASAFNVSVDVNTINTGVDSRDSHLKKEEYFDAEKYPAIKFASTSIEKSINGYTVKGNLTIKSVTKAISIPFTVDESADGLTLKGKFSINRKDFGVGGSSAVLSNTADISLKVFAAKS